MGWGGGMGVFCCIRSNIYFCRRCVSCGVGGAQGVVLTVATSTRLLSVVSVSPRQLTKLF